MDLPHGIPSHDTFSRVFSLLKPEELADAYIGLIELLRKPLHKNERDVIALDGKTLRRSFDRAKGKSATHMVSAWSCASGMVLAQIKTDSKSNEITAIPEVLDLIDVEDAIITIDAMGCQTAIAEKICEKKADYILALKGNQGLLNAEVRGFFEQAVADDFQGLNVDKFTSTHKGHGRFEKRKVITVSDVHKISMTSLWPNLRSVGMVEAQRKIKGKTSSETRYFISSLAGTDAVEFGNAVRAHWQIESKLHWSLDFNFREDSLRNRIGHGPENLAMLRHLTMAMLKKDESKGNINAKRWKCSAPNKKFLENVLLGIKDFSTKTAKT